jgi:hypothetical protein
MPFAGGGVYAMTKAAVAGLTRDLDREPYPRAVQAMKTQRTWGQHVYVDDKGQFPAKFNKWERKVIERALSKSSSLSLVTTSSVLIWPTSTGARRSLSSLREGTALNSSICSKEVAATPGRR